MATEQTKKKGQIQEDASQLEHVWASFDYWRMDVLYSATTPRKKEHPCLLWNCQEQVQIVLYYIMPIRVLFILLIP